jgi:hypothetical protein
MKIDNGITKAASKNHGLSGFCAGSMLSPMWLGLERIDAHRGKLQNFRQVVCYLDPIGNTGFVDNALGW